MPKPLLDAGQALVLCIHQGCSSCVAAVVQMEERRQREAEEQADDARRAAELRRQAEQDKVERKAAKAALQQHKKQLHREQVLEVKEEAKRRFKVSSCGCFVLATRCTMKHQVAVLLSCM